MSYTVHHRMWLLPQVNGHEGEEIEIESRVRVTPPGPQGGTWNRQIGTWEPPDHAEAELISVRWLDTGEEVPRVLFDALTDLDWWEILAVADATYPEREDI